MLTAHFVPMHKAEAREFCESSLPYVDAVEAIVRAECAGGETGLRRLTDRVDEQLGPFPEFATEIAAGIRSHLSAVV
jgi:hypothetical protein